MSLLATIRFTSFWVIEANASMHRGGVRQGAGRPHGSKNKSTQSQTGTLSEIAKSYASEALEMLAEVMKYGASDAARVTAAIAILDRAYGRPKTMDVEPEEDSMEKLIRGIQKRGSKAPLECDYVYDPNIVVKPAKSDEDRIPQSGNQMCLKIAND